MFSWLNFILCLFEGTSGRGNHPPWEKCREPPSIYNLFISVLTFVLISNTFRNNSFITVLSSVTPLTDRIKPRSSVLRDPLSVNWSVDFLFFTVYVSLSPFHRFSFPTHDSRTLPLSSYPTNSFSFFRSHRPQTHTPFIPALYSNLSIRDLYHVLKHPVEFPKPKVHFTLW